MDSARNPNAEAGTVPLVVDVDGTLTKTDLLHEKIIEFIARHPLQSWRLPVWLAGGRAKLKCELADRVDLDLATLPLRDEIVARVRRAQDEGRPVYLASASEQKLVQALADEIGGIAGVFGTDATANAAGKVKAEKLNAAFGPGGYDYIGDRTVDFAVWPSARKVLAVSHSSAFSRRLHRQFPDAEIVVQPRLRAAAYVNALRPHQWAKNSLVFMSPAAGHHFDLTTLLATLLAFVCFCLAASGAYVINDLLDIPGDRAHPRKRSRPFASGAIPVAHGPLMAFLLLGGAIGGALLLPAWFLAILILYVVATLAYSLVLKRKILIDVIVLGSLYTMRVLAGGAVVGVEQSPWLLMFSLFLFLGLAIVKRCSELVARRAEGKLAMAGRGYHVEDLNILLALGAAAGYGAVLVVALYIGSPEVQELYRHPERLWLICPLLLYWMSRILILSNRNELHDDPVIFALTDRVSWAVGAIGAAVVFAAI